MICILKPHFIICILKSQRATSQYKQAGEWDKAADTLAIMADIYRRQVDLIWQNYPFRFKCNSNSI